MNRAIASLLSGIAGLLLSTVAATAAVPNAFYAMDTSFVRPGLTLDQQLDLVKQLGYAGIAWHEQAPKNVDSRAVYPRLGGIPARAGLRCAPLGRGPDVRPADPRYTLKQRNKVTGSFLSACRASCLTSPTNKRSPK